VTPIVGGIATVFVTDLGRAVTFYTDVLGLRLRSRHGDGWAEVEAPGLVIGLHPAGHGPRPGTPGSISLGLAVAGRIEPAVEGLRARGVAFRGPVQDNPNVKLAFFGDPDGNSLYLFETKAH
jgi:catechol 2,3-dioxygenase-like lactoylglutathione lyase family enzyme